MKEDLKTVTSSTDTKIFELNSQDLISNMYVTDFYTETDLDFESMNDGNTDRSDFLISKADTTPSPSKIQSENEVHFEWSKKVLKRYPVTPFNNKQTDCETSLSSKTSLKNIKPKKYPTTPFNKQIDSEISSLHSYKSEIQKLTTSVYSENDHHMSEMEKKILNSTSPISINEKELDVVEVFGERGVLTNKDEINNWSKMGAPLSEYNLNNDQNPRIIRKKSKRMINYIQDIAIRYLRPKTPPQPGEIVIRQEKNVQLPPAPPLIIRQEPPRQPTPPVLVIREAPPVMPKQVGQKIIKISGKILPPPPRKVIVERFPQLPAPPPSLLIERWLPYPKQKRKVVYTKEESHELIYEKPKNVIIEWEVPKILVKKDIKYLGIVKANPDEYSKRYSKLVDPQDLPDFVKDVKTPKQIKLASDQTYSSEFYELEGDIDALDLIDLEKEGLGEYVNYSKKAEKDDDNIDTNLDKAISLAIKKIFKTINPNNDNQIDHKKAKKILKRVNKRIGKVDGGEVFANKLFEALLVKGVQIDTS